MLEGIVIQLPDGTTMTLADFNANVNSGMVDVSDAGFILPDGSILPTNGEPLFGAYPDEMIALMQPYIVEAGARSSRDGGTGDIALSDPEEAELYQGEAGSYAEGLSKMRTISYAILGLIVYLVVVKK
tara:strand:+ start:46 stop:429 length:384 start_codon:yes stop_codon:yes gene_type:complete